MYRFKSNLLVGLLVVRTFKFLPEFLSRPPSGATLPPGEGIGEGRNFHLALLLTVRTGHPGRGVPTGSLSVLLRKWEHGTMLTVGRSAFGRPAGGVPFRAAAGQERPRGCDTRQADQAPPRRQARHGHLPYLPHRHRQPLRKYRQGDRDGQTERIRDAALRHLSARSAHRFPRGWCSAQRIQNPMIAGGNHTTIPSCHGTAIGGAMTDEECGR